MGASKSSIVSAHLHSSLARSAHTCIFSSWNSAISNTQKSSSYIAAVLNQTTVSGTKVIVVQFLLVPPPDSPYYNPWFISEISSSPTQCQLAQGNANLKTNIDWMSIETTSRQNSALAN